MKPIIWTACLMIGFSIVASGQEKNNSSKNKNSHYEVVDFEGVIKRYLGKDIAPLSPIEGIYSVTCVITKRTRGFLTGKEKERIVKRADNYAKVAIIKDWPESNREYIEISLGPKMIGQYPIVGEFNSFSEGGGFVYNHYESEDHHLNFTFIITHNDLLEGLYSEVVKKKTITYKLSYLKIHPKRTEDLADRRTN